MQQPMYAFAVDTFVPVLRTLSELLDKGDAHAREKGFDVAVLMNARLAPDMYPLSMQVQLACHIAEEATARLTGRGAPPLENRALTFAELKALIAHAIETLAPTTADAFAGSADRPMEVPLQGALVLQSDGLHYLCRWVLPHFYFHVVTAYDILRHNGVAIGKRDYMSHVVEFIRQRADA
jgi:uncharacterized protein